MTSLALGLLCLLSGCSEPPAFAPLDAAEARSLLPVSGPERAAGQSATRLPDGRWLLLGGLEGGRPQAPGSLTAQLTHPRAGHTATVLPDGRVLVLGGTGSDGQLVAAVERFDPASGVFTSVPAGTWVPRAFHTATLLSDGRLLVVGGLGPTANALTSAMLWDTRTLEAEPLESGLALARAGHTASLLADGRVLLWGGAATALAGQESAEIFDPETLRFTPVGLLEREALLKAASGDPGTLVAGFLPREGAWNVAVDVVIGLRLSFLAEARTLDRNSLTLMGPQGSVAVDVTLAESGRLVFVHPVQALLPATHYTLYVQDLGDARGRTLPLSTLTFTTAATLPGSGRVDERLPRPDRWRPLARVDEDSAPVAFERDTDGRVRFTPVGRPLFEDDEVWLPQANHLTGRWHREPPEVKDTAPLSAPGGITALGGRVLRLTGEPLAGVRMAAGGREAVTDKEGRFLLAHLAPGAHVLEIDGTPAGDRASRYGTYFVRVVLEAGRTQMLPYTVWMPKLDPQGTVSIPSPTVRETVLTTPAIPGLELRLPPGTVVRDRQGRVLTELNITAIPVNQPPFPLPDLGTPVYFTIQPGGAVLQGLTPSFRGARLIYPNFRGEVPGARGAFWNYDARELEWFIYGQGTISADGAQSIPDEGVAIYELTGAMFNSSNTPPPPPGPPCNDCGQSGVGSSSGGAGGGSTGQAGSPTAGDPVMLASGQFIHVETDLHVNDLLSLDITRTYRAFDLNRRQFGVGTTFDYEVFLYSAQQYQEVDLIESDGTRVHLVRTSPGTSYTDAIFTSYAPGRWYLARLVRNSDRSGWDLHFRTGERWFFPQYAPIKEMYDATGNQLTIIRRDGNTGPVTRLEGPGGRWIQFTNNALGVTTDVSDNLGRTYHYDYDTNGRLLSVTNPLGGVRRYTYTSTHRIASIQTADGARMVENEYDGAGRTVRQVLADGSTFLFAYTLGANQKVRRVEVTDRAGNVRRVDFNEQGYIVRDAYPAGRPEERVTTFDVEAATGRLLGLEDALGRRSTFNHDARGNYTGLTRLAGTPLAVTTLASYTADTSQLASTTDALGGVTRYEYDAAGNLTQMTTPTGEVERYTYDSLGRLLSLEDAGGGVTTYAYDLSELSSVTDALGRTTRYFYDAVGQLVGESSPAGHMKRYERDALGRLVKFTNALGHSVSFAYDAAGRVVGYLDQRGGRTSFAYDSIGALTTRTDALSRVSAFTYDRAGRVEAFISPTGKTNRLTYNAVGRPTRLGFGASSVSAEDFESTLAFTYDAAGRTVRIEDSQGSFAAFTHDGLDRMLSETTASGTLAYEYDALDRRVRMTAPGQAPVAYAYDAQGRLISQTQGARTTAMSYDAAGRLTSITSGGLLTRYTYDVAGQLLGIEYERSGQSLGNLTYGYDLEGNRTTVGGTLARVILPAAVKGNAYDAANQLVSRDGVALSYDASGNLVGDGTRQYTWNARGQLVNISVGGVVLGEFRHDALGRRSFKRVRGAATRFLYDGQNHIQELEEGTSPTVKAWVSTGQGMDEHSARTGQRGTVDYLTDIAGSTVATVAGDGNVAASYSYEPYGAGTRTGDDEGNSQTYIGREDDGLGLMYMRARYYDPTLGRFLQPEPLLMDPTAALFGALNGQTLPTYAYALNNPMGYKDADGRMAIPVGALVGLIVVAGLSQYAANWCLTHACSVPWPSRPDDPPRPSPPPLVCSSMREPWTDDCDEGRTRCMGATGGSSGYHGHDHCHACWNKCMQKKGVWPSGRINGRYCR